MNKQIVLEYIEKYANKGMFQLDLSNPKDYAFYLSQLEGAGVNTGLLTAFGAAIQAAKTLANATGISLSNFGASGNILPVHGIANFETADLIQYGVTAITSLPQKAINITQTLGVFDDAANVLGNVKAESYYNKGSNCQIQNIGSFKTAARSGARKVSAVYTTSQTIGLKTMFAAEIVMVQEFPTGFDAGNPHDVNGNGVIKICLTRNAPDCDYSHNYGGVVSIPVKGWVEYASAIDVDGNGKAKNATSNIYIIRVREGGSPIQAQEANSVFKSTKTTITNGGKRLNWDLDWLKLKQVDFNSGERVYYVFSVTMYTENKPVVAYITNLPSILTAKPLNSFRLKPMEIVYGCLGAGTLITMSDGSLMPIEKLEGGEWVRSRFGKKLRVEHQTSGFEDEYLEITYGNENQSIISSTGHPFVTEKGVCVAKELKVGSCLIGLLEEPMVVKTIELKERRIDVFNLHLSTNFPAEELVEDDTVMYANGVLVGDTVMQKIHEDRFYDQEDNVLEELPDAWKGDFIQHRRSLQTDN